VERIPHARWVVNARRAAPKLRYGCRMHRKWPALAVLLALAAAPAPARAGEDEWELGVDGFGALFRTGATQWGGGAGIHASYGLTAAWSVVAAASWRVVAAKTDAMGTFYPARHLAGGFVGAAFALDVMRIVPFLQAGVGAYVVAGGGEVHVAPSAEVALSFDYVLTRSLYVGIDLVRARFLLLEGALATGFEAGLRASYVLW